MSHASRQYPLLSLREGGYLSSSSPPQLQSSEREHECFYAGVEELDVEAPVCDCSRLTNQLVEPLAGHRAVAVVVDIEAVGRPGGRPSSS